MSQKRNILRNGVVQSLIASLVCILTGLLAGYLVLCVINPAGAGNALIAILKNYFYYPSSVKILQYFGSTLVKTAPLLLCALSVLFSYKVGLFNIGVAGQYVAGAGASLFVALAFHMPWYICILAAMATAAVSAALSGALKAYLNVNEVISGIMLNWITLYSVNMLLALVKDENSPYTKDLFAQNKGALLPGLGLGRIFSGNKYVTIAIPVSVLIAVGVWILLEKTRLGFELKATGLNKYAARYCGMREKFNIILTMTISGTLAGLGGALYYLSGIEQWSVNQTAVPGMGFNGIAAAFLGGLNPIGTIIASYFIQHISSGGSYVDMSKYCAQISDLISALIIYLCSFVFFFKIRMNILLDKLEKKRGDRKR